MSEIVLTSQYIAQKAAVIKNGSLLLIHYSEAKYVSEKVAGKWGFPGGKIEPGEEPDESMIREVKDETGVKIKCGSPFYIWSWVYNKDMARVQIVAIARFATYLSGKLIPAKNERETKIDRVDFIPIEDLRRFPIIYDEAPLIDLIIN